MTLQEYATTRNISYEAVRQAVKKSSPDIDSHITKQGRTRILDDEAVRILDKRRKDNKVSVISAKSVDDKETIDVLKNKIIVLQEQLLQAQQTALINAEAVAKLEAYTDINKRQQDKIDTLQAELGTYHRTIFGLYKKDKV